MKEHKIIMKKINELMLISKSADGQAYVDRNKNIKYKLKTLLGLSTENAGGQEHANGNKKTIDTGHAPVNKGSINYSQR